MTTAGDGRRIRSRFLLDRRPGARVEEKEGTFEPRRFEEEQVAHGDTYQRFEFEFSGQQWWGSI